MEQRAAGAAVQVGEGQRASPADSLARVAAKLARLYAGDTGQVAVTLVGDSWTDMAGQWAGLFADRLAARFGDAGGGWTGLSWNATGADHPTGNARPDRYPMTLVGKWGSIFHGAPTPRLGYATSYHPGGRLVLESPADLPVTSARLYPAPFCAAGTRYRWNAGGWSDLALDDALATLLLADAPAGATRFELEVRGGYCALSGVELASVRPGVRVNKVASNGTSSLHWSIWSAQPDWRRSFAALGSDLVIVMLGANDQGGGRPVDGYRDSLDALLRAIAAASPTADLLVVAQPENARGLTPPMAGYARAARRVSARHGAAFLDLQPAFGEAIATYRPGAATPLLLPDGLHPSVEGAQRVCDAVWRFLIRHTAPRGGDGAG